MNIYANEELNKAIIDAERGRDMLPGAQDLKLADWIVGTLKQNPRLHDRIMRVSALDREVKISFNFARIRGAAYKFSIYVKNNEIEWKVSSEPVPPQRINCLREAIDVFMLQQDGDIL